MKSITCSEQKIQLTIILLAYLIFALIFGFAYKFAINPDGIAQLRLAGYIAEGNFQHSISMSWSPLFTWLMSIFLFLGFDGLTTARIAIALSGAGLLIGSWFLSLRFGLSRNIRFIALLIAALLISDWTIRNIGADLPVAALVTFYLYVVTHPQILSDKKISFYCGIVGGMSYLAHHYALPFVLVHLPLMLFLRGYIDSVGKKFPLKQVLKSLVIGIAGLLIIVSMWVGIASVKYGRLAISSKGSIAYSAMGPRDIDRRAPHFYGGLHKPVNKYSLHVFEDHSELKFKTWSPFESKEYFMHQMRLIKTNFIYILDHFVKNSPFFTYCFVIGTLTIIPIALLLNPLNGIKRFLYGWVIITFVTYCSGYLLIIARSPRRFYALMIIFLFLSFHFLEEVKNGVKDILSIRRKRLLSFYLLIIIVMAFTLKPGVHFLKSMRNIITIDQINPYYEIAEQIDAIKFSGPYAVIRSSQKPHTDTYIAYYLKKQFLGRPLSKDVEGITKELKAVDAKSLIVFDNLKIVEKIKKDKRYINVGTRKLRDDERYVNAVNINQDEIIGWDKEVNIFEVK